MSFIRVSVDYLNNHPAEVTYLNADQILLVQTHRDTKYLPSAKSRITLTNHIELYVQEDREDIMNMLRR